jgi:hypothetical protein
MDKWATWATGTNVQGVNAAFLVGLAELLLASIVYLA